MMRLKKCAMKISPIIGGGSKTQAFWYIIIERNHNDQKPNEKTKSTGTIGF
jgi:hypothetical protein